MTAKDSTLSTAKRPKNERYTAQQVAAALVANKGFVSLAARSLRCTRDTVYRYMKQYSSVKAAADDEREYMTDVAELALYDAIQKGEPWAVQFYLKTQGKQRGYVEKQQHEHSGEVTTKVYAGFDLTDV